MSIFRKKNIIISVVAFTSIFLISCESESEKREKIIREKRMKQIEYMSEVMKAQEEKNKKSK